MEKAEMMGIKEMKEMMIGLNELSILLVERFSDGAQFDDFLKIWDEMRNNMTLQAKLQAAYEGYKNIGAEVKELDIMEMFELVQVQFMYVPKFIEMFRKKAAAEKAKAEAAVEAAKG